MTSFKSIAVRTPYAVAGLIAFFMLGLAQAETVSVVTKVPIISTTPDKYDAPGSDGKPRGLSGMGCLDRTADGNRQCLVIIDDETFGQVVTLKKEGLVEGVLHRAGAVQDSRHEEAGAVRQDG